MKKTTSKKKSIWKKLFIGLTSIVGIFVVSVCTYFIAWRLMMQPKSGYQPQLTNKEESYFKALETKKGWSNITRLIKNINNKEERLILLDFKTYHKVKVIYTAWYWNKC